MLVFGHGAGTRVQGRDFVLVHKSGHRVPLCTLFLQVIWQSTALYSLLSWRFKMASDGANWINYVRSHISGTQGANTTPFCAGTQALVPGLFWLTGRLRSATNCINCVPSELSHHTNQICKNSIVYLPNQQFEEHTSERKPVRTGIICLTFLQNFGGHITMGPAAEKEPNVSNDWNILRSTVDTHAHCNNDGDGYENVI